MEFGPVIKNPVLDINKLVRQGTMLNQSVQNVEGDSTADQATVDLLSQKDPVIQEISVGMSGEELTQYTVSGTPPLSLPNSLGKPLKAWSVDLLPYQEGTGDPAPDNVRPIHGTDKLTIYTSGKNQFNTANLHESKAIYGSDAIGAPAQYYDSTASDTYTNIAYLNAGYTYTLSWAMSEASVATVVRVGYICDNNGKVLQKGIISWENNKSQETITAEVSGWLWASTDKNATNLQLEIGSSASEYVPFVAVPSSTTITMPTTSANQWDEETELGTLSTVDGSEIASSAIIRTKSYVPVESDKSYYVVCSDQMWMLFFDENKNIITTGLPSGAGASNNARNYRNGWTMTAPTNCKYVRWYFRSEYGTTYKHDTALNYPSTVNTYNPYDNTMYNCTVSNDGGESRDAMVDMGDMTWDRVGSAGRFYSSSIRTLVKAGSDADGYDNAFAETYKAQNVASLSFLSDYCMSVDTSGNVQLYDSSKAGMTGAELKTALSGIKMVYKLATPVQFALSAPTIPTPTGTATTWATAEDGVVDGMEVTYVGKV